MQDFREELKKVPELPGVYLMHDKEDRIIYVGKAIVLRNRLRQYFNNTPHTERITKMISNIERFEYIVTDSEYEALLLECNLIKKHRPKYNVLLKDDKNYPYIKVTTGEDFPKVFMTRKKYNDGNTYFGPYYLSYTVKSTLDTLSKSFPLRNCNRIIKEDKSQRVCLNYHIGLCPGPCGGYISKEDYNKNVQAVLDVLSGKVGELKKQLTAEMQEASENLEFEKAAGLRDRIKAIDIISEKQKIISESGKSLDAVGVALNETDAVAQMLHITEGQVSGRDFYVLEGGGGFAPEEIYVQFITQFYGEGGAPKTIIINDVLPDEERGLIERMLTEKSGHRVEICTPQRGDKLKLCKMAAENAEIALKNYEITKRNENGAGLRVLEKLKILCGLENLPLRIEAFDISNLGDAEIDGSMVVFENGRPEKKHYRHYKIKTLAERSDVGAMKEMLERRYTRLVKGDTGFEKAPELILMDGGQAQISEAKNVLEGLCLKIPVFGMVKDNKHRSRGLLSESGEEFRLEDDNDIWRFVTDVQNEVHRFAIEYNRKLTEKRYKRSPLDGISGIGEAKKVLLLRKFGSVAAIRKATEEELCSVPGIGPGLAKKIKEGL